MNAVRLFTAIPLPPEVREHLCAMRDELDAAWNLEGLKWTAPQNMHVTLKFLGGVPEESVPQLIEMLSGVRVSPARLHVDHVTGFRKRGRAHVVVGALGGQCELVELLFAKIDKACESIGVARDRRRYTPHVTIGRSREGVNFRRTHCRPGPTFVASSFDLVKSQLTPSGPIYERLATYNAR
jgi:2'-5' RNA ligase